MALYLDAALLVLLFAVAINYMRNSLWSSLLDVIGWLGGYGLAIYLVGREGSVGRGSEDIIRATLGLLASLALMYLMMRHIKSWMRSYYVNSMTIMASALVSPAGVLLMVTVFSWVGTVSALEAIGWGDSQVLSLFNPVILALNDIYALLGLNPHHPATDLEVANSELLNELLEVVQ